MIRSCDRNHLIDDATGNSVNTDIDQLLSNHEKTQWLQKLLPLDTYFLVDCYLRIAFRDSNQNLIDCIFIFTVS